jgi:hypothetical protein
MRFMVRSLRSCGRRLPWREVRNGPAYTGDLITYELQAKTSRVFVATIAGPDPAGTKALPDPYEPVLAGISTLAFRLRGFERHEGGEGPYAVVQEWHCESVSSR